MLLYSILKLASIFFIIELVPHLHTTQLYDGIHDMKTMFELSVIVDPTARPSVFHRYCARHNTSNGIKTTGPYTVPIGTHAARVRTIMTRARNGNFQKELKTGARTTTAATASFPPHIST